MSHNYSKLHDLPTSVSHRRVHRHGYRYLYTHLCGHVLSHVCRSQYRNVYGPHLYTQVHHAHVYTHVCMHVYTQVRNLSALRELLLNDNQLTELPAAVDGMARLELLEAQRTGSVTA